MSKEMYTDLFDGTRVRTVNLELLEESYQRAMKLALANGWPEDEALLTVFAHGLATLTFEGREAEGHDDVESLRRRLMSLDGMYSVMKFRTFTLTQENQRMAMALSAYQQEHPALMRLVERLRAELEDAKRASRTEETDAAPPQSRNIPPESETQTRPLARLRALLSALFSPR